MIKEFKKFISKGNIIDLSVAVIMGAAFGKIVSSLVDNILMPIIGVLIGGTNFTSLSINIGQSVIGYGIFIQNVVDFLIISLCIFLIVKFFNKFKTKTKEEVKKSEEVLLLEEIRDLLKNTKN